MPLLYKDPLFTGSRALSTSPKRRVDGGVSPLLGGFFLEGGLVKWDPSLVTIKRSPSPIQLKPIFFPCDVLGMVWPFTFDWCVICASELVRSAFRTPCCRVLVHKTCLYSSLAISPSSPTPTCLDCQQVLGLRHFRRLCWRLSGRWSQWFECPLLPLTLILTIGFTSRAWVLHVHRHRLPAIPTKTG